MQGTKAAIKETGREMPHILVVDDEKSICELLEITFRKEGHRIEVVHSVDAAKRKLESQIFDIIISDIRMPGAGGMELLKFAKEIAPDSFFLLMTGVPALETAIAAINSGADRYVIKGDALVDQLRRTVREVTESLKWKNEAGYLRRELRRLTGLDNIIGQSPKMRAIFDLIQTVAPQTSRVLITDESGNMSLTMQVKLYRVLQEGKVRPIGSTEESDVDVRIIAATNKNFEKEIAEGHFREDLYYRLSVIPIHVPALRERRDDIPLLARHFLERFRKSMEKPIDGISPEAMTRLESYDWPGNVRELENTMERAVALETGREISLRVLPDRIAGYSGASSMGVPGSQTAGFPVGGVDFEKEIAEAERRYLQAALEKAGGVRTRASELLKISYRSFRHYAKKHNL